MRGGECVLFVFVVCSLRYLSVVTLFVPKGICLSLYGVQRLPGILRIKDATFISNQEDMEARRKTAEDLTTSGQSAHDQ